MAQAEEAWFLIGFTTEGNPVWLTVKPYRRDELDQRIIDRRRLIDECGCIEVHAVLADDLTDAVRIAGARHKARGKPRHKK